MSAKDLWKRYQDWLYDDPETGFRLDLSRMGLPDDYTEFPMRKGLPLYRG